MKTITILTRLINIIGVLSKELSKNCNSAYSQCGGESWKGITCCEPGYICKAYDPYYSECIPSKKALTEKAKNDTNVIDLESGENLEEINKHEILSDDDEDNDDNRNEILSDDDDNDDNENKNEILSDEEEDDDDDDNENEKLRKINMNVWQYNENDNVYYQTGVSYCKNPVDTNYENLSIFVPGDYLECTKNSKKIYSCKKSSNKVNGYTSETAPIVMPINTPDYLAMESLKEYYYGVTTYTNEGFIYVHAGCRGRDAGAPAGVTDLKAAVRYLRYCKDKIPGNTDRIFTFGMSEGGAQSAIMGSSGDSHLYEPYLEAIGAVPDVSDAIYGSVSWCPITNLDTADESYEWMMGITRKGLTDEEQKISDELAKAWADYINSAGIKDKKGNVLKLEESSDGIYQAGSYYNYIKGVIEESLSYFLKDGFFPYEPSSSNTSNNDKSDEDFNLENDELISRNSTKSSNEIKNRKTTNIVDLYGTYDSPEEYLNGLNAYKKWVDYDPSKNKVTISSISDFVYAFKSASKDICAFDQLDRNQNENELFGFGDGKNAHFDKTLSEILTKQKNSNATFYVSDLKKKDSVGYTMEKRLNMYTPLYYLLESNQGYGTSNVAKHWRIRSGIAQTDTALTTEVNLALALQNNRNVSSIDFETVWDYGHIEAERNGDNVYNFISWVNKCLDNTSHANFRYHNIPIVVSLMIYLIYYIFYY